jgi:NADPH:quinone reductase-like Zn-dependent oxidoreductase
MHTGCRVRVALIEALAPAQSDVMHALATDRYGALDRLRIIEVPLPAPGPGEVRVRVHATALNPADYKVAQGRMKFLHARTFPLVLGYDFSGVVDALGRGVADLRIGDAVFGFLAYGPGNRRGAFAQALIARTDRLALKPAGLTHAQAAAGATPGVAALQSLRDLGRIRRPGQRVLVTGVSGGVGSLAVGVARRLGAVVTAVGSGRGLELASTMGADRLIDRTREDPVTACPGPLDAVFDAAAAYRWRQWRGALGRRGAFVTTIPSKKFVVDKLASLVGGPRCELTTVTCRPADLRTLGDWMSAGLVVPVDSTVALSDVPAALDRLERGGVLGRIVVEIQAASVTDARRA